MRSYETARSLFSFLAFFAWGTVIIGGLIAIAAAASLSKYAGSGAGILAMGPGIGIAIVGLLQVAFIQIGRANVDTAEYTQQMLGISRDQLEVSRQSLKQGDSFQKSFIELKNEVKKPPEKTGYSAEKAKPEPIAKPQMIAKPEPVAKPEPAAKPSPKSIQNPEQKIQYEGYVIVIKAGVHRVDHAEFQKIEHAKEHIDMLRETENMRAQIAALSAIPEPALKPVQITVIEPVIQSQKSVGPNIEYNGKAIEPSGDKFVYNSIPFTTLEGAKKYIDNFNSAPPKTLPGVKRT